MEARPGSIVVGLVYHRRDIPARVSQRAAKNSGHFPGVPANERRSIAIFEVQPARSILIGGRERLRGIPTKDTAGTLSPSLRDQLISRAQQNVSTIKRLRQRFS